MKCRRKEALHVGSAEPVELAVTLGQHERVVGPALSGVRDRVGMPRKHEPILAVPEGGNQVRLARPPRERLDPHRKPEAGGPLCQQIDDPTVRLIEALVRRAHRRRGHQLADHVDRGR